MLAQSTTCNTQPATIRAGTPIPEIRVATEQLDSLHDLHFGLSGDKFDALVPQHLHGLGPRSLDIRNRGGRTAEDTWKQWIVKSRGIQGFTDASNTQLEELDAQLHKEAVAKFNEPENAAIEELEKRVVLEKHDYRQAKAVLIQRINAFILANPWRGQSIPTPGFGQFFMDEFRADKDIKPGHEFYPPGAMINGELVAGKRKYRFSDGYKTARNIIEGNQFGTAWSKAALDHAAQDAWGMIHFHLDGLGDIEDVLGKRGNYSHNVTARELRFVCKNWTRFRESVTFYNGYDALQRAVMVKTPWAPDENIDDDIYQEDMASIAQ